jgi:hypothetical protein
VRSRLVHGRRGDLYPYVTVRLEEEIPLSEFLTTHRKWGYPGPSWTTLSRTHTRSRQLRGGPPPHPLLARSAPGKASGVNEPVTLPFAMSMYAMAEPPVTLKFGVWVHFVGLASEGELQLSVILA